MPKPKILIQLFNSANTKKSVGKTEAAPNHLWGEVELREQGFDVITVPTFSWPLNPAARFHNAFCGLDPLRALRILITRRRATIVCAHLESSLIILLLRRILLFHPPVIIWEVPWSPGWTYRETISRLAISRADCSIVFGSNQITSLKSLYGQDVPVEFVPFCVDTEFFKSAEDRVEDGNYLFSTGLDLGRDFSLIVDALDGTDIPAVIKIARNAEVPIDRGRNIKIIRDYLSFSEYRDLYARSRIVVVTTKQTINASGVTSLLEAMAMSKPVIVSDNVALRDYLPPTDAGIVVPVGDAVALRSAIVKLFSDPEAARRMGKRAREFVEGRFDPRTHFKAVGKILDCVTKSTSRRP